MVNHRQVICNRKTERAVREFKRGVNFLKKTMIGALAATCVLGASLPVAFAASTSQQMKSSITLNGQTLSTPYTLQSNDGSTETTFVPIYYINQALTKSGYKVAWNGNSKTWNITVAGGSYNPTALSVGSGNTAIYIDGHLVKRINTVSAKDPVANKHAAPTTYVPVYYAEMLLQALGVQNTWNGSHGVWTLATPVRLVKNSAVYGPASGKSVVHQDIVVTGQGVTVQNTKVIGSIFANPGKNGETHFQNVQATQAIVVLSGATHSIDLSNVTTPNLDIDSSSPVRIVASNGTTVKNTVIPANEAQSVILLQNGGSLGNVTVESHNSITLAGTTPFASITYSGGTLTVGPGVTLGSITIGSNTTLVIAPGAIVGTVNVSAGATGVGITNNGTVTLLNNQAASTSVTVSGTGTVTNISGNTPGGIDVVNPGQPGTGTGTGTGNGGGNHGGGTTLPKEVQDVNSAASASALQTVLGNDHTLLFGSNSTDYNTYLALPLSGQAAVAGAVIAHKPAGGYTSIAAIATEFHTDVQAQTPTDTQMDADLATMVSDLNKVHGELSPSELATVQTAEGLLNGLNDTDWAKILPGSTSASRAAIEALVPLFTFNAVKGDLTVSALDNVVNNVNQIDPSTSTISVRDLYDFMENLKPELLSNLSGSDSTVTVLATALWDTSQMTVSAEASGQTPFNDMLKAAGITDSTSMANSIEQLLADTDPSHDAIHDILQAVIAADLT